MFFAIGTTMDGLDIVHIHWTQEHPEAPLKMDILHYGEVPFEGGLKGMTDIFAFTASANHD